MRIISRKTLKAFMEEHPEAKAPLDAWWAEAKAAQWASPMDIKKKYHSASILKRRRVVFNIGGNKYRLVVKFDYERRVGYIRFVGTHRQYDEIDAETV